MKQDWELSKKRYDAFWQNEAVDRCVLYLDLPSVPPEPEPESYRERWMDIEARTRRQETYAGRLRFMGDGFPFAFVNFGPGVLAAFMGSSYEFGKDTIWFDREPLLSDWDFSKLAFDTSCEMWRAVEEMTSRYLDGGKVLTSITDLGGTLDILASLRGSEPLIYDLYDEPEKVHQAIDRIESVWERAYTIFSNQLLNRQGAITSWMPIWCRERYYPLQCDFSAMISPAMFGEFVLPNLRRQTEFLDHAVYHLDGPGEIPHVDQLLTLPRLTAIQWTPGAGCADLLDPCWFELYQKILSAGKGLVLMCEGLQNPERLEYLLSKIPTKGLFISSCCTEEQALEALRIAEAAGVK
jgi:hypothetical protein